MNAPANIRPWNHESGVHTCETCEGTGKVHAARRATVDDPYPEADCRDCAGEADPECPVCGSSVIVTGYDCIVCQMVADLPDAYLCDGAHIAEAVGNAIAARIALELAA